MSLEIKVIWLDLDEFKEWFEKRIPGALKDSAIKALKDAADLAVVKARILAPTDTGSLRRTICQESVAETSKGFYIGVSAGDAGVVNPRTGREVDYACYVEYGSSRARAQPYLRPALLEAAQALPELFTGEVERRLKS